MKDPHPVIQPSLRGRGRRGNVTPMERYILQELAAIVAPLPVLSAPEELLVYECDGHTLDKALPSAVVFPATTEQVVAIVQLANKYGLPFVARGAGTGLS